MRGAAPKSCVCATSRLAPTHVPALSALPGVLERSKVAFGSRHPGNLGLALIVLIPFLIWGLGLRARLQPGRRGCLAVGRHHKLMGWTAPLPASRCHRRHWGRRLREPSTMKIATVGLDLAIDVRRADELLQLLKVLQNGCKRRRDVLPHSRFLRQTLQAEPIAFAFRAQEVRVMVDHDIDQIRMLPG